MLHSFKKAWLSPIFTFLLLLSLGSCKSEDPYSEYDRRQREYDDQEIQKYLTDNKITNYSKSTTGLYYLPGQIGTGNKAQTGSTVTMHFISKTMAGQKYESTYDSGIPFTFKVGESRIIGLNEGATLMNKGEKSILILPSRLASGTGVLLYEVNMLDIK